MTRRWLPSLLCLILAASTAFAAPSLEALMSAPFPSGLSASPLGGAVAWVENAEGVRNLWIAESPEYRPRQLTAYTSADGQGLSGIEWTPDGRTILFVRGGSANRQGEFPNPTSDPAGAEQSIWKIATGGGTPVKIAEGSDPAIVPGGEMVAWGWKGAIQSAPLDGSAAPSKLVEVRGNPGGLRWSPDGSKLAFVSRRGTHSIVGVFDAKAKRVRYLSPSVDDDSSPVWSPDGTRVAFMRDPVQTSTAPFMPRREGHPWSILVADASTGEAKTIWAADRGRGSAWWEIVAKDQLFWTGDRIVFGWERDGWIHLYSMPASGGTPKLLTPGEFEVEFVSLTPDRRHLVYNSNQGDIDRRHLWRVPVDGSSAPVPLTPGRGIEWAPQPLGNGAVALLRSDGKTPAHPAILEDGKARPIKPVPASFPAASVIEPQQVIFAAADGMKIHGQLFLPPAGSGAKKHPALLFFHGGSRRQMLLGWNYSSYYHNAYSFNQYMANRGYVVLSVNYRSGIGYGMEFREALNYGARGASEFNDVMGAGLYLRSRPDVDPERIGLWGGSYGGYLTALGLARASDLFAAGVDIHGVHDWNVVIQNFQQDYDPVKRTEDARLAYASSPMAYVDGWRSPVLLIHGDDDRNVPFSETVTLVEQLRKRDVPLETIVFPDEVHSFLLHEHWMRALKAAAEFFDRHLTFED